MNVNDQLRTALEHLRAIALTDHAPECDNPGSVIGCGCAELDPRELAKEALASIEAPDTRSRHTLADNDGLRVSNPKLYMRSR